MYAQIENSIAVLSDMKANKSYVYHGKIAENLGLSVSQEIQSIWEDEIFSKIHPEDLIDKHLLELQFFNLLTYTPISERVNFHVNSKIRMQDKTGKYISIHHRMFYICGLSNGTPWLALCLYNILDQDLVLEKSDSRILNSVTGKSINPDNHQSKDLLSLREKEILHRIRKGKISKEIASEFSISVNTVNRHRQNILKKLRVSNSHEACRIAELMNLI